MDSVPAYAAVNETVNLARRFVRGKDKFINGVLRGYLKNKEIISLPDSEKDPVKYLSIAYSVNAWIVKLWLDTYGKRQGADRSNPESRKQNTEAFRSCEPNEDGCGNARR